MTLNAKDSFGQYLRRERILREITIEEIAEFTKIKKSTLSALENDDFDHLPSLTFVRGFIRTYAEYLGLNVQNVMLRFTTFIEEEFPELTISKAAAQSRQRISRPLLLGFLGVLILLFFFYSYRYINRMESEAPDRPLAGSTLEVSPPSPSDSSSALQGPSSQVIQIKATELCWIQVILDNQPPCEATLYPGNSIKYEAKEKIRILIGNAGGVNVKYNDKPLGDLGPSGRPTRLSFPEGTKGQPSSGQ